MTHALKTWPEYFDLVYRGTKHFEIRKNDRDYKVGDKLLLQEWNPLEEKYTRREMECTVTYILSDENLGIKPGYVLMSIKEKEY